MKLRWLATTLIAGLVGVFVGVTVHSRQAPATQTPQPAQAAPAQPQQQAQQRAIWMKELSNWGRWGQDDELGAVNLITQEKRRTALALAKTGTVVSLARNIVIQEQSDAINADGKPDRFNFFKIRFRTVPAGDPNAAFAGDIQEFAMHGGTYTHLDGLCHQSYAGQRYNGFPLNDTDKDRGCSKLGVQVLKDGIVTRGVLIDFPRLKGASTLAPGTRLRPEDVEAWEKMVGLRIAAGDAVFLYNGWREGEQRAAGAPAPGGGYDISVMPLMHARDVAVLSGDRGNADHPLALTAIGAYLIDNAGLENLAQTAARLQRWEFLLVVAPIAVPGATGSIVNPLAIF